MSLLQARGLRKYYPVDRGWLPSRTKTWLKAIDGIDFALDAARTLGVIGESGCGKTTTAKLILRLERPTAGSVLFQGKDINQMNGGELRRYRHSVQAVFQDPYASLDPRMRVGSILSEPLEVNKVLAKSERGGLVREVLELVGLSPMSIGLYPHEFSGGQRQRIALARALVLNPSLTILDEPVSALDVSLRGELMNLFKDLQEELGLAYLLIAHNLATVRYLAHEVLIMYLGKIMEEGATEEVFCHPLHPYTRALLSAALPFHPDARRERIILQGEVPSPIDRPAGCSFHPRCFASKIEACMEVEPTLKEVARDHRVACHLC